MSKFLAPIHTWLFNKIVILERIEKELVNGLDSQKLIDKHNDLLKTYGPYIPNQPLEDLIDQSNIHGWLQERITIAEKRQSAFVNGLMEISENAVEAIMNVYRKVGETVALEQGLEINNPTDMYNALNNVLLEGMPCDRVNVVLEQTENKTVWKTQNCVHKSNWEASGTDVSYYYKFRQAFTTGFVRGVNDSFDYNYTNENQQTHEIIKK